MLYHCELCVDVCLHNEPHLGLLFFHPPCLLLSFSLKCAQLGFSGHSFFPGFYVIVFRKKDLVAHPEPDQRPHRGLPTWEQRWVCEQRMPDRVLQIVWWSHSAGWWGQIQAKTTLRCKRSHSHPPPPHSYSSSQSLHLSLLSLSSHPVFVRHILPKISSTVSCRRDVLATISRV